MESDWNKVERQRGWNSREKQENGDKKPLFIDMMH
jgi:hypothetical protein